MLRLVRFAVVSAFLVASTSLAAAAATVTITPAAGGPPTTQVKVKGFAAGKLVDVYFDTRAKCVLISNAKGGGTCSFKSPATARPGTHWVTAAVRATGTGVQKSFLVRTDWTDGHGLDAGHSGFNRYENTISPKNVHLLTPVWTVLAGKAVDTSPVVHRGRLFIGAGDGKLYAFDATTGAVASGFPRTLGSYAQYGSPVVANGIVYHTAYSGSTYKLYAVGAATGTPVAGFTKDVGPGIFSAPVVVGGKVVVTAGNGKVYGFDAKSGVSAGWSPITVPGGPLIATTAAFGAGKLYFGTGDGNVHALDPVTGGLTTVLVTGAPFDMGSPAFANGLIAVANSNADKLYAIDAVTGTKIWAVAPTLAGVPNGAAVIAGGQILISAGSELAAIDVAVGATNWTRTLGPGPIYGSTTAAAGVVFTGAHSGIYAADAETGALLWQARGSLDFNQSIPIANGMIYAPGIGGKGITAHAIRGASGLSAPAMARPAISDLKPDRSLKP